MFVDRIERRQLEINSSLCIGLDPNISYIKENTDCSSIFDFNKKIINITSKYALCFKPQVAHYSALGIESDLERTIQYINEKFPMIPVILDAKRGDIGDTAKFYAQEAFDRYSADAVTVSPYLGDDSIAPFMEYSKMKGTIVLAKTSNVSSDMPQSLKVGNDCLFQVLSQNLHNKYIDDKNLLFVVGGTDLDSLRKMRESFPSRWFLVPGIGSQGADIKEVLSAGKCKMIINVTRSILYPKLEFGQNYDHEVEEKARFFSENSYMGEVLSGISKFS